MCINISDITESSLISAGTFKLPVEKCALIKPSHTLLLIRCIFFIFSSKTDKSNSFFFFFAFDWAYYANAIKDHQITAMKALNRASITSHFMNISHRSPYNTEFMVICALRFQPCGSVILPVSSAGWRSTDFY